VIFGIIYINPSMASSIRIATERKVSTGGFRGISSTRSAPSGIPRTTGSDWPIHFAATLRKACRKERVGKYTQAVLGRARTLPGRAVFRDASLMHGWRGTHLDGEFVCVAI
jgi:hypothetical protein